jgi:hypothetical protein
MTATIIEEEVDTDSITLLDFSYAPECEFRQHTGEEQCEEQAEYRLVLSCCAEVWLLCEDHMLRVVNFVKRARMPEHNPKWGGCGGMPVHFTIIERL